MVTGKAQGGYNSYITVLCTAEAQGGKALSLSAKEKPLNSTTTTPVRELADRKRWARATSKRLKHSRAHKELLAHLAFRAGCGRVWNYSLGELAQDCDGSKPHVQRGLTLFAAQGLITVKRNGPKASEYAVHFEIDPKSYHGDNKELSKQIDILDKRKLEHSESPPPPPPRRQGRRR